MKCSKNFLWVLCLCCAFLVTTAGNGMAAWGSKELETEKTAVNLTKEVMKGGYKIVSTEELKGWIDSKKDMLIIDTMPYEDSYKKEHVPGAVQFEFPKEEVLNFDDKTKAAFQKMLGANKDRLIVFYCGFTKCGRSHNGATWATKMGYKNVYRYPGGIKAWGEADYPVEKVK
jgi:thiosulfate/3-mercaptopyruvate sulfurtransferase